MTTELGITTVGTERYEFCLVEATQELEIRRNGGLYIRGRVTPQGTDLPEEFDAAYRLLLKSKPH